MRRLDDVVDIRLDGDRVVVEGADDVALAILGARAAQGVVPTQLRVAAGVTRQRLPRPHPPARPLGGASMSAVPAPPRAPGAALVAAARVEPAPLSPATAAVLRTETRLFGREIGSMFWIVALPRAAAGASSGSVPSFREPDPNLGGLRHVDLYVPVSVLLSMLMAAIMAMPPVVFGYREAGVLRRMRTTPVRPLALLAAQVAAARRRGRASPPCWSSWWAASSSAPRSPAAPGWYLLSYLLALLAVFGLGAIVTAVRAQRPDRDG